MDTTTMTFVTDAATFCVFDVEALSHRLNDDGDWWTISREALTETNAGNAAIVDLGQDGEYTVKFRPEECLGRDALTFVIKVPSGRVFIGAGEEITGGGLEPEAIRGGAFVFIDPGMYRVVLSRASENALLLAIVRSDEQSEVVFDHVPRLDI